MNPVNDPNRQPDAFPERVMAAIASMPIPSPTRSLLQAVRAGSGHDVMAAVTVAWHLATQRDWPIAPRVRARSFALVLAVATILGTGSMMAASAARVIVPHVDRTEILESRGSIILEPVQLQVAPTSSTRPQWAPGSGPAPVAVPVSVSKPVPVPTQTHSAPPSGTKHPTHGGSSSAHDTGTDAGGHGTSMDPSDDADGSHHGGDGTDDAMASHEASDGDDTGHGGDDGHDGGRDHQVDDDGGSSDD